MVKTLATVVKSSRDLRAEMPIAQRFAYFDHAAVSPLPAISAKKIELWANQASLLGDTLWPQWARDVEATRAQVAGLLDANETEIALVPNTTFGINAIASGIPWQAGDSMVVPSNEFSSNLLPWKMLARRGVDVRIATMPPIEACSNFSMIDHILPLVDQTTKMVSVSWVSYSSGFRCDLAALCECLHARGVKFFVDAIQGLGAFPLSVRSIPIDFLAADGHKWMLGPEGAGLLYVREKHLDWLQPTMVGWNSVVNSHHFSPEASQLKANAQRYEGGSVNMPGQLALGASIELLRECNLAESGRPLTTSITDHCNYLVESLRRIGVSVCRADDPNCHSGIVPFRLPGIDSAAVRTHLLKQDVVLSVRHGFLRAAVHGYNSTSDIDRLIEGLSEFMR
jgi:cysteine desulfurase / selenocysteine lyase